MAVKFFTDSSNLLVIYGEKVEVLNILITNVHITLHISPGLQGLTINGHRIFKAILGLKEST